MRLLRLLFLSALWCCNAASVLAAPAMPVQLRALTEALPPLNYELNGQVVGFSSDLLDILALEAGVTVQKQLLPWARAYRMALDDADTVIYSLVRMAKRKELVVTSLDDQNTGLA